MSGLAGKRKELRSYHRVQGSIQTLKTRLLRHGVVIPEMKSDETDVAYEERLWNLWHKKKDELRIAHLYDPK